MLHTATSGNSAVQPDLCVTITARLSCQRNCMLLQAMHGCTLWGLFALSLIARVPQASADAG